MRHRTTAFVFLLLACAGLTPLSVHAEDVSAPRIAIADAPTLPADWPPDYPQTLLDAVIISEELLEKVEEIVIEIDGFATNEVEVEEVYFTNMKLAKTETERVLVGLTAYEALPVAATFDAQMNHWRLEDNLAKIRFLLPELERLGVRLYQVGTI